MVHLIRSRDVTRAAMYSGKDSLTDAEVRGVRQSISDFLTARDPGDLVAAGRCDEAIELCARSFASTESVLNFAAKGRAGAGDKAFFLLLQENHQTLAELLDSTGCDDEALDAYVNCTTVREKITAIAPNDAFWLNSLSVAYESMIEIFLAKWPVRYGARLFSEMAWPQ